MTDERIADEYERRIRGTYLNVPAPIAGLCRVCSAPTSGPGYELCVPCDGHARSGLSLARGVVPLSWSPMGAQGYQDLTQYKDPMATAEQTDRLRVLLWLALTKHADCIIPARRERPFAVTHVPSTSGLRSEMHPLEVHLLSMIAGARPRATPLYVGPVGGDRNARRVLRPDHWQIDPQSLEGAQRVLILDDTWVTGSHAQSVAAAFESMGVATRIVVLGRALDRTRSDQGGYLTTHRAARFDSDLGPVQGVRHHG